MIRIRFDSERPCRPQVDMVVVEGDSGELPESLEEDEQWATPVLCCASGEPKHVVPFDQGVLAAGVRPVVVIHGPWKSGTNVLKDYVERFFDVTVPVWGDRGWKLANYRMEGEGGAGDRMIWKHEPLRSPVILPATWKGRPIVILSCIREPTRWINALAFGAYELKPGKGNPAPNRRGYGDHTWLQKGPVFFDHPCDQRSRYVYASADKLWVEYAYGMMKGRLVTTAERHRTRIVRHEDLVLQPMAVLRGLELMGLPRKVVPGSHGELVPFRTQELIKGGHWTKRDRALADLQRECMMGGVWERYCLEQVADRLDRYGPLLDVFGYQRRDGSTHEPVNTFGADVSLEDIREDVGPDEIPEPASVTEARRRSASVPVWRRPPGAVAPLLR